MLRIAVKEAHETSGTKLRALADTLIDRALTGDVQALKEVADRIEGKVPTPVAGDPENPLHVVATITRRIVHVKTGG